MLRRLSSNPLPASVAAAALVFAPLLSEALAQTATLRVGEPVPGSFAEGAEPVRYSIEVGADTFLFGEVNQISVDVVVRILDADGEQVARFDGPARGGERFVRRLREAGVYAIEVAPFEKETGDYAITLFRLEPVETDPIKFTDQMLSP